MEMHLHPLWTKNKCTKQSTKVNRDGLEGKYDNSTYRFADVAVWNLFHKLYQNKIFYSQQIWCCTQIAAAAAAVVVVAVVVAVVVVVVVVVVDDICVCVCILFSFKFMPFHSNDD